MRKRNQYPSKKTVNLAVYEKSMGSPRKVIPAFLLCFAILALFVRFFVIGPLGKISAVRASVSQLYEDIHDFENVNLDYEQVEREYREHFSQYLDESEAKLCNRIQVLTLVQESVMDQASLKSLSIRENICRVVIEDVTLSQVSSLVSGLEASPQVEYVAVSTAVSGQEDQQSAPLEVQEEGRQNQQMTAELMITLTEGGLLDE